MTGPQQEIEKRRDVENGDKDPAGQNTDPHDDTSVLDDDDDEEEIKNTPRHLHQPRRLV